MIAAVGVLKSGHWVGRGRRGGRRVFFERGEPRLCSCGVLRGVVEGSDGAGDLDFGAGAEGAEVGFAFLDECGEGVCF